MRLKTRKKVNKTKLGVLKRRIQRMKDQLEEAEEREVFWLLRWNKLPLTDKRWKGYYDKKEKARFEVLDYRSQLINLENQLAKEAK